MKTVSQVSERDVLLVRCLLMISGTACLIDGFLLRRGFDKPTIIALVLIGIVLVAPRTVIRLFRYAGVRLAHYVGRIDRW